MLTISIRAVVEVGCLVLSRDIGYLCKREIFFFQAEGGIRDLVRSRGLGDVYKRQGFGGAVLRLDVADFRALRPAGVLLGIGLGVGVEPVSYTHLTLPTSDLV